MSYSNDHHLCRGDHDARTAYLSPADSGFGTGQVTTDRAGDAGHGAGISHLDNAPKAFDPAWLEPVMCCLHAYAPDVILTEAMSGEQLAAIEAYKAVRAMPANGLARR